MIVHDFGKSSSDIYRECSYVAYILFVTFCLHAHNVYVQERLAWPPWRSIGDVRLKYSTHLYKYHCVGLLQDQSGAVFLFDVPLLDR